MKITANKIPTSLLGIQLTHINKSYGKVNALCDVSLNIHPGELFGLIGPDGAGKTTLFRILTTLVLADEGKATVCGWDVVKNLKEIRCHVGYMPGHFSLYQDLTVEENLNFFATVFQTTIKANYEFIRNIYKQLEPFKDRRVGKLSGGMKQKLALCCALIHRPNILFLDEPTTGVDPVSRKEFWEILERLKSQGVTVLVSTPYMDEASRCDRIALMREGKVLLVAPPEAITRGFNHPLLAVAAQPAEAMYSLLKSLREYPRTLQCFSYGNVHHLTLKETGTNNLNQDKEIRTHYTLPKGKSINERPQIAIDIEQQKEINHLRDYLTQKGFESLYIKCIEPSIEDCFMLL